MKKTFSLSIVPMLLMVGCLDAAKLKESQGAARNAIAAKGQATANLYLIDMATSAAKPELKDAKKDISVSADTEAERLKAMSTKMMDRLDLDDSGTISKKEFLAIAKGMGMGMGGVVPEAGKAPAPSAEDQAAMQKKLEEQFDKFSGGKDLTMAQLQDVLKAQGDRVAKFREENFPGQQDTRVKEGAAEILAKFDLNKDGTLDDQELAALRASDKDAWRKPLMGSDDSASGKPATAGTDQKPPVITIPSSTSTTSTDTDKKPVITIPGKS